MASFDDIYNISKDTGFRGRCQYALTVASVNVLAEVNTTTNHAARVVYAKDVLDGNALIPVVAMAVLTNSTIAGEATATTLPDFAIPDSDIQFSINSLFNSLAGVST